jgi:hypothetical protein
MAHARLLRRVMWTLALMLGLTAGAVVRAQPTSDASRNAFHTCDDRAFLALTMARNYLMTGRNKDLVLPHLNGNADAEAMAEELFRRVEANEIRHPGQFAADVLTQCASDEKLKVGASRSLVATCFVRTDVAFFMHGSRADNLTQVEAVRRVSGRLKARDLYPMWLITDISEAVYRPAQAPELRPLMGAVAWGCIHRRGAASAAQPASAASR